MPCAASKKAYLARVRNNQRRSRARRREYLSEMESRLKAYELRGIEASAEVQVAATKVVEENKRLRILLNEQGFSNEELDDLINPRAAAQAAPPNPEVSYNLGTSKSAQVLEFAMVPHITTMVDASASYKSLNNGKGVSPTSMPTNCSPLWETTQQSTLPSYVQPLAPAMAPPMAQPLVFAQDPAQSNVCPLQPTDTAPQMEDYSMATTCHREAILGNNLCQQFVLMPIPEPCNPMVDYMNMARYSQPAHDDSF